MIIIVQLLNFISQVLTLLVILQVVLSYFMSPFHPLRRFVDRVVEPLLAPIRQVVPPIGMVDFSPLVFIILLQIVVSLISRIFLSV